MKLPKRAYITFANEIYADLVIKLAETLDLFSDYKLIVYTYNFNLNANLSNIIAIKMNSDIENPNFIKYYKDKNNIGIVDREDINTYHALVKKFDIVLDALSNGLEEGFFIDCDSIVRKNVDEVFSYLNEIENYPLATKGVFEYMMWNGKGDPFTADVLERESMDMLNIKNRSMHYVQSGYFLFNTSCKDFFMDCQKLAADERIIKNHVLYAPYHDETILNLKLWQINAKKQLPLSYYNVGSIIDIDDFYKAENKPHFVKNCPWHVIPSDKNDVKFFHGCKSVSEIDKCIIYLKNKEMNMPRIFNIHTGLLPIPPNGWGATEKIIWEYHQSLLKLGFDSQIVYLDDLVYKEGDIVHIHMANLALLAKSRNIPYYFTCHDHHAYLYGKDSYCFKENYEAIKHSVKSFVPAKYLVEYFDLPNLYYLSHGVNIEVFKNIGNKFENHKLLCIANNGFIHDASEDRKGFSFAIEAAQKLNLPITVAGPSNNKKFFERYNCNYDKLNIIYDLNENDLIELYQSHTIFLSPSILEAGHPNLTLLEALSCGLPVLSTFEKNNELIGLNRIERNVDHIVSAICDVITNYDFYCEKIKENIHKKSWTNIILQLLSHYNKEYKMKDQLIDIYKNTDVKHIDYKIHSNIFKLDYNNGCKLEISGNDNTNYTVQFFNKADGKLIYESNITNNMWTMPSIKYFIDWHVKVSSDSKLVYENSINLKYKRVCIINESPSLGDLIAWMPYVEEFRKKHDCLLDFYTPNKELFASECPLINFKNYGVINTSYYATYKLGYFDSNDFSSTPKDNRTQNLQQVAAEILGLEYKEIQPKIDTSKTTRKIDGKYVCITTASTAALKHWQNSDGWQQTVDYLNQKGYQVVVIQKEPLNYMDLKGLNNVIHPKTNTLNDCLDYLNYCDFYIGLGSGISWLAWALGKKVIMINGFSKAFTEFNTPYRVTNLNVCNGCWNDTNYQFNKGVWNWCPRHQNTDRQFECSKNIYFADVKKQIDNIIYDGADIANYKNLDSFVFSEIFLHNQYELYQKIEENDFVVDLGCSKGYLYLKNKNKNITYLGIDASIDCINDFVSNLSNNDKPVIMNAFLSDKLDVQNFKSIFHENAIQKVSSITFENLISLINKKIDFLKFDIEAYERLILNNNYDLFKKSVRKFSGEIHFLGDYFPRHEVYKTLERIKNDKDITFKLFSIDGIDITENFWNIKDYYNEIIINGLVN